MPESVLNEWVFWLFWSECAVFGLGSFVGILVPDLVRVYWHEVRMETWAMRIALGFAILGGLISTIAAGAYLAICISLNAAAGFKSQVILLSGVELGSLQFPDLNLTAYIDPLAALFILLIGFFSVCVAIYSFGWLEQNPLRHSVAGGFTLFVFTTLLVVIVDNAFWLLLSLELMSLSFGFLVLYRGRRGESRQENQTAVQTYLIVSHLSTISLAVAILILGIGNESNATLDLAAFRDPNRLLSPGNANIAFLFALVGLGIRVGMTPFHFWVPIVHPQSPTTTHAFSLGVSIKVGIFLMIRFFFEFLKPVEWWWGAALLVLAGTTALMNVFYALLSRDLKRALAYHSVENIGIILAGLGLALLFASEQFALIPTVSAIAGVALIASLLHVFNHALFKSLLYLGTGSIENRTGTVVMEQLGGLIHRFRWTSTTFLIGAVAIAGFPPFNGFISEWLILQSFFAGTRVYGDSRLVPVLMVILPLSLIALAMSFAITALAFVKITGETLLGFPRDPQVAADSKSSDVPPSMRSVMSLLAFLCLVLGLLPGLLVPLLAAAINGIGYETFALQSSLIGLTVSIGEPSLYTATLSILPLATLVVLPLLSVLAAMVWRRLKPPQTSPTWVGGETYQAQTMQYTGSALASLVWQTLSWFSLRLPDSPLPSTFVLSSKYRVVEPSNRLLNGFIRLVLASSTWVGEHLQTGDIRVYLLYIFAAFIGVLVLLILIR